MPTVICLNCENQFEKLQKNIDRSPSHFCCRSCSVSYNNHLHPRRFKSSQCKLCSATVSAARTYCHECWHGKKPLAKDWNSATLGEVKAAAKYQAHAVVRKLARSAYYLSKKPHCCFVCGYSLHVDICHRKAIASFSAADKLSHINRLENLVALCKNHHWEFDSGLLDLSDLMDCAE